MTSTQRHQLVVMDGRVSTPDTDANFGACLRIHQLHLPNAITERLRLQMSSIRLVRLLVFQDVFGNNVTTVISSSRNAPCSHSSEFNELKHGNRSDNIRPDVLGERIQRNINTDCRFQSLCLSLNSM